MAKNNQKPVLILGDIHAPFHNKMAFRLIHKIMKANEFSQVISVGDVCDAYSVSRFDKSPDRKETLQEEVDGTLDLMRRIKEWAVGARCVVTLGNHDIRINKAMHNKYAELGLVRSLQLDKGLAALGWEVVPYKQSHSITEHIDVTHDFGKSTKNAAMSAIANYGGSVVWGHSHAATVTYTGSMSGPVKMAMNVGWLGDYKYVDYQHYNIARQNYILGVGLLELGPLGLYKAHFIPFVEYAGKMWACMFGTWYSVKA